MSICLRFHHYASFNGTAAEQYYSVDCARLRDVFNVIPLVTEEREEEELAEQIALAYCWYDLAASAKSKNPVFKQSTKPATAFRAIMSQTVQPTAATLQRKAQTGFQASAHCTSAEQD